MYLNYPQKVLMDTIRYPVSLAVFENKLYWSDWQEKTIQSCDKFTGKNWRIVIRADDEPYDVHIEHSAMKPKVCKVLFLLLLLHCNKIGIANPTLLFNLISDSKSMSL